MKTSFFFLFACFSTTSVPCTLVSIVCTGCSTINFTPTADVVDRTGGQVVEHRHLVAVAQQSFGEVGSDEPGASGNQSFHAGRCPFAKAATVSATRTMSSSESRGDSGSDNSWPAAETATGHSCETNAANAGCFVSAAG